MRQCKKIDDDVLLEMFRSGTPQKDIAAHFCCSPAAITKRLKRLLPSPDLSALTVKQQTFAIEMAKGKTATDAAMVAYNCKDRNTAKVVGCQQMQNEQVRQSITELLDRVGLSRLYRVTRLKHHVDSVDPIVGLRALETAFKLGGDFPQKNSQDIVPSFALNFTLNDYRREGNDS